LIFDEIQMKFLLGKPKLLKEDDIVAMMKFREIKSGKV